MIILHIINGLHAGGAEATLFRLCHNDYKNKHVVISLLPGGKFEGLLAGLPISLFFVKISSVSGLVTGAIKIFNLIRDIKPEVVNTWMPHANLIGGVIAKFAGVPKIIWCVRHSTIEYQALSLRTIVTLKLNILLSYFIPSCTIFCSDRAIVEHLRIGYSGKANHVIHNGFEREEFRVPVLKRGSLRAKWSISDSTPLIGMVGRYDAYKDHKTLLEALARLDAMKRSFFCVLVGKGVDNCNAVLQELIERYKLKGKVMLLGRLEEIPLLMSELDIHILSSVSESFPNVVAEAMAVGTPSVVSDVGDAARIVGNTGWVVPRGDSKSMALSLGIAIDEFHTPKWARRREDAIIRIFSEFSIEKMIGSYRQLWEA
jgi:glycosyltransferase involved in cell wall biosynthesis